MASLTASTCAPAFAGATGPARRVRRLLSRQGLALLELPRVRAAAIVKGPEAATRQRTFSVEDIMIDLYNSETNAPLGSITEAELKFLVDSFEEESLDDRDYFVSRDTIEMLADGRATDHLLDVLRKALGDADGVEISWKRR